MADVATVSRHGARGMITLRGDLGSAKVKKVAKTLTGQGIPATGKFAGTGDKGVVWMSPDDLLVMVAYHAVSDAVAKIDKALAGEHYLAVDVSDARAVFTVAGAQAREAIARVCPVDLHKDSFGVGDFRRTRMAQVAAAFWMHDAGFDVVCFRSVGDYVEGLLFNAAKGARVGALG